MVSNKQIDEAIELCFKEMFFRVGETYPDSELTKHDNWYMLRSWTEHDQERFQQWMVNYLRKKLRWSKKKSKLEASFFIMNYGWTTRTRFKIETIKNEKTKL